MTRIYLFPGQGSQKAGMGAELFPQFPELVAQADRELGYSIAELCLRDPQQQLSQTRWTQPAIFVVNCLTYLAHLLKTGKLPHYTAGHSLGEYSALFAAGVFDFPTGVRIVNRRANLMAEAKGGGMAAVIGLKADAIRQALATAGLGSIDLANLNSNNQIVISGPSQDIDAAQPILEKAGAQLYKRLPVSGAFHSRYMSGAMTEFARFLGECPLAPPRLPVLSNFTARPYAAPDIAELLARQITQPVRWVETVQWLKQTAPDAEFLELGPGNVLTGLLRRIQSEPSA